MKTLKRIPKFNTIDEEIKFWENNDSTEYVDYSRSKRLTLPNLKPTTKSISIRLPEFLLERLKVIANKKDIPYQSLIKIYLLEKVKDDSRR